MRRPIASVLVLVCAACSGDIGAATDAGVMDAARAADATVDAPGIDATPPPEDAAQADAGAPDAGDERRSLGCVSGAGLPEGEATFELDGLSRLYRLRLPADYTRDRAWPLVLALHPNGSNADYWDGTTGARAIRTLAAGSAIVVMAQARMGDWRGDLPVEIAYFDHVISELTRELCVDETRIFSMGFSGGGSFSGVLGCVRDDIRAIASGGAVIYFEESECVGHPAAWLTLGEGELAGREPYRDFWRDRAGCEPTSTPTEPTPCIAYDACDTDTPVHYCQHAGGHEWPSFGTQAAWDFFTDFF
jgi:polyhydroxybutyrate depolymerase